jgi:hypothetical protein
MGALALIALAGRPPRGGTVLHGCGGEGNPVTTGLQVIGHGKVNLLNTGMVYMDFPCETTECNFVVGEATHRDVITAVADMPDWTLQSILVDSDGGRVYVKSGDDLSQVKDSGDITVTFVPTGSVMDMAGWLGSDMASGFDMAGSMCNPTSNPSAAPMNPKTDYSNGTCRGAMLVMSGTGLGDAGTASGASVTCVSLGDVDLPFVGYSASPTETLTVSVPNTVPTGMQTLKITTKQGTVMIMVNVFPGPVQAVSVISPTSGPVGTSVTATGTNLASVAGVKFIPSGQTSGIASKPSALTDTSATFAVPFGSSGTYDLNFFGPCGSMTLTGAYMIP